MRLSHRKLFLGLALIAAIATAGCIAYWRYINVSTPEQAYSRGQTEAIRQTIDESLTRLNKKVNATVAETEKKESSIREETRTNTQKMSLDRLVNNLNSELHIYSDR